LDSDANGRRAGEHFDAPISKYIISSRSVLAFALVVAAKRYFSEYFAPFLIALLPLAVPILRLMRELLARLN
jgi:hypothetical protein